MSVKKKYADVLLPVPLKGSFTYSIPDNITTEPLPGTRVIVQFGRKKIYTGLIWKLHSISPENYETKDIISILDENPVITSSQFPFWQWMADYYMCSLGEIYKAALPSGLKLESESEIQLAKDLDELSGLTSKEEAVILELEKKGKVSVKDVLNIYGISNAYSVIKTLLDKGIVEIEEKLIEKYKAKTVSFIELNPEYDSDEKLGKVFDELKRAKKQLETLMYYIKISDFFSGNRKKVTRSSLLDNEENSPAALKALLEKGIFIQKEVEVSRIINDDNETTGLKQLADFQQKAIADINKQYAEKDVVLLHGITSSGKTEIYIQLIHDCIQQGKQVLYLLPEIALTTQIIERLKNAFGDKVGIYHSKFSDNERVEVWKNILENSDKSFSVILGVRSSVFLPFSNLGLIIVDEEHENTYKQYDPAPRYNARDAAIMMGLQHKAKVLLGTATPSFESYFNAESGRFGFTLINQRYQDIQLPEILIANIKQAYKRKEMQANFTPLLVEKIGTALENKEQVILFQNRRGFSPYLECDLCAWIPKCDSCDVSLTYHKQSNQLRCHYCGSTYPVYSGCKACGNTPLKTRGFGTEKIEDDLAILFPDAKIGRMDLDTTRSRKKYEMLISDFENQRINILIGTQMITKGLDFDNVSVVGIMNADNMLNFPDFRAFERSFQLMSQVSGRAGRKRKRGQVVIQTSNPEHPIIKDVVNNSYVHMYNSQMAERNTFRYPPYFKLIEVTIKHKNQLILNKTSDLLASELRKTFKSRILGPESPIISRIQNYYIKNILIKIEREKAGMAAKDVIQKCIDRVVMHNQDSLLRISIDVDPL